MLKKIILVVFVVFLAHFNTNAQTADSTAKDTLWRCGGLVSLSFNQVALNNWAAGGESSLSLTGLSSLYAYYHKDKVAWDNNLDLGYGILKQGDATTRKNEDKIECSSKLGYQTTNKKLFYTALVNFKSQFADGYNFPNDSVVISRFLAPAFIQAGLGIDYKPNSFFSLYISPITARITIVNSQMLADQGLYGVDPAEYSSAIVPVKIKDGKKIRSDVGSSLTLRFRKEVMTNVIVSTKLELFSNYSKNPENIIVNWEILLSMKVNKFISASIYTQLLYDQNVPVPIYEGSGLTKKQIGTGPRTQFKEVLGIGLTYNFKRISVRETSSK